MNTENGFSRLAKRLDNRSREIVEDNVDVGIEIGEIDSNMALKLPRFATPIPNGDYAVAKHLTVNDVSTVLETESAGEHTHSVNAGNYSGTALTAGAHTHRINIVRPNGLERLKTGDRVIVVWDGSQAVVVDVIVNSSNLRGE